MPRSDGTGVRARPPRFRAARHRPAEAEHRRAAHRDVRAARSAAARSARAEGTWHGGEAARRPGERGQLVIRNVTVGIDHGTSNSAVAFIEDDKPVIIKPDGNGLVMPSAVYIDKRGRTLIGATAVQAMMTTGAAEGNGHTGYKLRIGQDDRYEFGAARKVMTAPELGAIVIGKLLQEYRTATNIDPKACVITVPANFEQSAIEGTRQAARKAGLVYCPFLQEPIAAALAYGFNVSQSRAQWLVFDLGGGTLDVSIVIVRNGEMVVPTEGHAGDTRL